MLTTDSDLLLTYHPSPGIDSHDPQISCMLISWEIESQSDTWLISKELTAGDAELSILKADTSRCYQAFLNFRCGVWDESSGVWGAGNVVYRKSPSSNSTSTLYFLLRASASNGFSWPSERPWCRRSTSLIPAMFREPEVTTFSSSGPVAAEVWRFMGFGRRNSALTWACCQVIHRFQLVNSCNLPFDSFFTKYCRCIIHDSTEHHLLL